jgi:hypothetical protein
VIRPPGPSQLDFLSPEFQASARAVQEELNALLAERPQMEVTPDGVYAIWRPRAEQPLLYWQPKLYVCLSAADYWRGVTRLLQAWQDWPHPWKFHLGGEGQDRPDKLLCYFPSQARLEQGIASLRQLLAGCAFHTLDTACATPLLGLEEEGRTGLYAASDPVALGTSWGFYSQVCRLYLEREAVPDPQEWCARLNLSQAHPGPRALVPLDAEAQAPALATTWSSVLETAQGW